MVDSSLATISCCVPQSAVLGHPTFLLYLNELNQVTKFWKVRHFADENNDYA